MEILLYTTQDADTVMNKTLELKYTIQMEIKDAQNITQPTIALMEYEDMKLDEVNYAFIPDFNRYYFIRSYNVAPNQIYHLMLECDVIETFKEEILQSQADISRVIEEGDYLDVGTINEVRKEAEIYESNKGFADEFSILFSTIGQDIGEVN